MYLLRNAADKLDPARVLVEVSYEEYHTFILKNYYIFLSENEARPLYDNKVVLCEHNQNPPFPVELQYHNYAGNWHQYKKRVVTNYFEQVFILTHVTDYLMYYKEPQDPYGFNTFHMPLAQWDTLPEVMALERQKKIEKLLM